MKKIYLLPFALAGLVFGACSSDDVTDIDGNVSGGGRTSYVSVNLMTTGTAGGTRAGENEYDQGGGTYEDGTDDENKVTTVRFYLFNKDGQPYELDDNNNANYKDVTSFTVDKDKSPDHGSTVEEISETILVINGRVSEAPYSIVAIVNPPSELTGSKTLAQLKAESGTGFGVTTSGGFVMSNSVYSNSGTEVCETLVENKVKETAEEAKEDPVDIYVERVVAKVYASLNTEETNNVWEKITTGEDADKYRIKVGNTMTGTAVYAVVDGWRVADENGSSNLLKKIDTSWKDADLGITPWTTGDYHRSFWATSVAIGEDNTIVNHNWDDIANNPFGTAVYTQENTPTSVVDDLYENTLTKVIVAARLQDANGNALAICKYKGIEYIGEDAVKTQIAGEYASKYYKADATVTGGYAGITAADLEFVKATSSQGKDYHVVAQLKSDVTVYKNDGTGWVDVTSDANTDLAESPAEVRSTTGTTYYYTTISHLGSEGKLGQYGIVRNHSYKVTIDKMEGFGTPVYDPTWKIDPTIPDDTNTYLAARINILSWRVVSSNVNLDVTK